MKTFLSSAGRRIAAGVVFALAAAASLSPLQQAWAASVTLSGATGTSCAFNSVTGDASGNFTFVCQTATTPGSPGALSLSISSAQVETNGATVVTVIRSGGSAGQVGGTIAATGGCSLSATAVSFADNSTAPSPASLTVTAPAAAGTCAITLSAVSGGAALGSPSTATITVTAPAPPPPPPPVNSCTTTATFIQPYVSGNTVYGPNKPGESTAVAIPITSSSLNLLNRTVRATLAETASAQSADVQFSVSACPGDFSKTYPCSNHTQATGGYLSFSIGPKPATTPWYIGVCELPADTTTVYFNFRNIKLPTPTPPDAAGTPSCVGTCGAYVQVN